VTTIQITNDYTVLHGQNLAFSNETAFYFNAVGENASLYNFGNITINATTSVDGITSSGSEFYFNSVFWNEAGASYVINESGAGALATGYYAGSWQPGLHNSGLFEINSTNGNAEGWVSWSPNVSFVNDGTFQVNASGNATGVFLYNGGTYTNSGLIDVSGASALAIELPFYSSTLTNTGTIIAETPDGQNAMAVYFDYYFGGSVINNSGTITGDIGAPAQSSASITLTNSGTITGNFTLGIGQDTIHNDGAIVGNIDLGNGNDTFDGAGTVQGTIYGGLADDTITGTAGNDVIFGDNAVQSGQDGNDVIHAGGGNDVLTGGLGNDVLDGGSGIDTIAYATAPVGVTVNLAITGSQDTVGAGTDTITNVENVTGSAFDDTLTGDAGNNVLAGGDGNDTIKGGGGNDTLNGGDGTDTAAYSGLHTDYTVADSGGTPTSVSDTSAGTPDGSDTLTGIEKLQFGDGTFVYDNAGNATATRTDANGTQPWSSVVTSFDTTGSLTGQTIVNDNGTHWVNSYDPANAQGWTWKVDAYDASNRLVSQSGTNDDGTHWLTLNDVGNQYAWATATIQYDANWNTVSVTGTNDDNSHTVSATSVETALDGITWFATPYDPNFGGAAQGNGLGGGAENDLLYGHAGNDTLDGGAGNDILIGGGGDDLLTGGAGNDRFVFGASDTGNDTITDFSAGDVIELHGYGIANFTALQSLMSQSGSDTVITIDTLDHITLHGVTPAQLAANEFLFT